MHSIQISLILFDKYPVSFNNYIFFALFRKIIKVLLNFYKTHTYLEITAADFLFFWSTDGPV